MDDKKIVGLTEKEVTEQRKKYGTNNLGNSKQEGFGRLLLETLGDPIIKILLIALAIKTVVLFRNFDWYETIGILIAIFLASFISSISEYGSEKAFVRLQDEASKIKCRVKRDGKMKEVLVSDVVKGDMVFLSSGDKVPADGILIHGEIVVDESLLTGESIEIYKNEKNNKVYRGSIVYQKMGWIQVTEVGEKTFYGRIFQEVQEKKPESPLKNRLRELAQMISKIGYIGAFLGAFSYLFSVVVIDNHFDTSLIYQTITNTSLMANYLIYALTLAITIIILAVPEGLPVMITLVLSSNMRRMLKNNVLVRKLVGIETAGNVNLLLFDKTGTITKGKPIVHAFFDGKLRKYESIKELRKSKNFSLIKLSCIKNNEGVIENGKVIGGNSTDRALLEYMKNETCEATLEKHLPFDSKTKYTKTKVKYQGKEMILLKGAHEKLLPFCNSYYDENSKRYGMLHYKIEQELKRQEQLGLRIVMFAITEEEYQKEVYEKATFLGFCVIKDEVREEAKPTIESLNNAQIKTIMITGDNKDTAICIAKEINLLKKPTDIVLTSQEFSLKTDWEVKKMLPYLKVVARALPTDKSRLVKLAIEEGYIVGMTGDGVNDAPALKKANVGFAMGSGTEVAKEASDIVILDDNIKSIAQAILFGRTIFKSIRKFIIFQLSLNICAVFVSVIAPLLGIDTPVTVIQMLWINMIMDSLAALAFSYEAPLKEYMKDKPKPKEEAIINSYMKQEIILAGFYSGFLCLLFLKLDYFKAFFRYSPTNDYLMTAFFGLFIFIGIFNSFNARTSRLNLLCHLYSNKVFLIIFGFIILVQLYLIYFGGSLFRTYGLTLKELEIMLLLAFSIVPIDWIRKILLRKKGNEDGV